MCDRHTKSRDQSVGLQARGRFDIKNAHVEKSPGRRNFTIPTAPSSGRPFLPSLSSRAQYSHSLLSVIDIHETITPHIPPLVGLSYLTIIPRERVE